MNVKCWLTLVSFSWPASCLLFTVALSFSLAVLSASVWVQNYLLKTKLSFKKKKKLWLWLICISLQIVIALICCRYASWCAGDLPHDTPWEASDDVQRHPQQGDSPYLQEVHARCNCPSPPSPLSSFQTPSKVTCLCNFSCWQRWLIVDDSTNGSFSLPHLAVCCVPSSLRLLAHASLRQSQKSLWLLELTSIPDSRSLISVCQRLNLKCRLFQQYLLLVFGKIRVIYKFTD